MRSPSSVSCYGHQIETEVCVSLVGCLVGRLVLWSVLIGWIIGWLVGWIVGLSFVQLSRD